MRTALAHPSCALMVQLPGLQPDVAPENMPENSELLEDLMWMPSAVTDGDLVMYLRAARSMAAFVGMCDGGSTEDGCAAASMDETTANALDMLHLHNYDTGKALQALVQTINPKCIDKRWSEEDAKKFAKGVRLYGKNFFRIRKDLLPAKETCDLVEFYYFWKKTPAAANNRPHRRHRRGNNMRRQTRTPQPQSMDDSSGGSEVSDNDSDDSERELSSYACHRCHTTKSKVWHPYGKDNALLCTECRPYYKKYGEEHGIEAQVHPPPFMFKPVREDSMMNRGQDFGEKEKHGQARSESPSESYTDSSSVYGNDENGNEGDIENNQDELTSATSSSMPSPADLTDVDYKPPANYLKDAHKPAAEKPVCSPEIPQETEDALHAKLVCDEDDDVCGGDEEDDDEEDDDDEDDGSPDSSSSSDSEQDSDESSEETGETPDIQREDERDAERPPVVNNCDIKQEQQECYVEPVVVAPIPDGMPEPSFLHLKPEIKHEPRENMAYRSGTQDDVKAGNPHGNPDSEETTELPPVPPPSIRDSELGLPPTALIPPHLPPPPLLSSAPLSAPPPLVPTSMASRTIVANMSAPIQGSPNPHGIEHASGGQYGSPISRPAYSPPPSNASREAKPDDGALPQTPVRIKSPLSPIKRSTSPEHIQPKSPVRSRSRSPMRDSDSEPELSRSPSPAPRAIQEECYRSKNALFVKCWWRGYNSCSRCDFEFHPHSDSKLAKRREERFRKASSSASSSRAALTSPASVKEERKEDRREGMKSKSPPSADAHIISHGSQVVSASPQHLHTGSFPAERLTPRGPYMGHDPTPALRQLSEYARPHIAAGSGPEAQRSLPYSLGSLPPHSVDPYNRMPMVLPNTSRERLEMELERDKRERDARERELREIEFREKMKQEMDLKPPGFDRLPHGMSPLDPNWVEYQRRLAASSQGSVHSSGSHIPGVYPPVSLASDLLHRERERIERERLGLPITSMSGSSVAEAALAERISAERLHAERLAMVDPMIRLQLGGGLAGAQAAAVAAATAQANHTHTHAHAHTHLHLHQPHPAEALLNPSIHPLAGPPPPPTFPPQGIAPIPGQSGISSGSSQWLAAAREQELIYRDLLSRPPYSTDPVLAHQLTAQAAAHQEAIQRQLALDRERLGGGGPPGGPHLPH